MKKVELKPDSLDVNLLAKDLSDNITAALDIVASMKTFTIKPKYVHSLSDEAKQIMRCRDFIIVLLGD